MLEEVKHVILILSGKGGVGKSTVASQLALTLVEKGYKVGVLDIDLCGPSIPYLLGADTSDVHKSEQGWIPVYARNDNSLAIMSIGFLLSNKNNSVVWRGPKKTSMIKQFLTDVCWGDLDYLIIDTPPGTSDEHMTIVENLKDVNCDGAVIITTPQRVSVDDVLRQITFCKKSSIPILGLVENMSGFTCPSCKNCFNIFSKGGGEALAELANVPLLGSLPTDPQIEKMLGKSCVKELPNSSYSKTFSEIVDQIIK